jgi:hypothetical protein
VGDAICQASGIRLTAAANSYLPGLKRRIEDAGVRLLDPPREHPAEGLWLRDPDGVLFNVPEDFGTNFETGG